MKRDEPSVVAKSKNNRSLKAVLRAAAAVALSLFANDSFALDGSQVVTGGGSVDFTGASSTNWVVNPETGALDFLIAYSNATETAASFSFNGLTSARILAVGGGGGGGAAYRMGFTGTRGGGGGGGAGGFVETEGLYDKGTFDVTVGEGGKAGAMGMVVTALAGGDGSNTTVTVKGNSTPLITAYGGGGGGGESTGRNGGSGGGGSQKNGGTAQDGGTNLVVAVGQGHNGGKGDAALYGGGGGGAGADGIGDDGTGFAASTAGGGRGGDGRESDITGTPTFYAGGGGGGWSSSSTTVPAGLENGIPGGKGGGGAGGVARNKNINPVAGLDGFGGGGGGCNGNNAGVTGGARGGCGVVIVRVTGSLNGALDKPKDTQVEWDGAAHNVVTPAPFYTIEGDNSFTDTGVYTVKVTPVGDLVWADSGTREAVTVTLTIYQKDSISGTEYVTGAPVSFYGATATNWVSYTDSSGNARQDLVLTFTNAASFKLPGASSARILAVGGGGGGGAAYRMGFTGTRGGGGGGGAGGFVETEGLYGKGNYAIRIGKGGKAGVMGMVVTALAGGDGGDTTVSTNGTPLITAYGGGGGGGESTGRNGGSGGGGSQKNGGTAQDGGTNLVVAVGQGHNGGAGDAALYGGGGGGAGADGTGDDGTGFAASTAGGGRGGDGRESDITGTPTFYAGGGGGGWSSSSTTVPAGLENGIPGGKGGGGAGGVARNKGINPVAGLDGFGGGGGGCNGNNAGVTGGAKGGCGVVIVRISSAMEGEFKRPATAYTFTYDATEHAPVKPNVFYDVTGKNFDMAGAYANTTAGVYVATVKLHDDVSGWPEGGPREFDVTNTIKRLPVEITELSIAGWTFHDETTPDPTVAWTTDPAKSHDLVKLVLEYGSKVEVEGGGGQWSQDKPSHAGTYWLRARSSDTNNFACAEKTVEFSVDKLSVTFSELNQLGWMSGTPTEATPNPSCTVEPIWVKKVFEYESETEPGTWGPTKPTLPGEHKVRVRCENDTDYTYNNLEATFDIINGLGGIYHDYVEITIGLYLKSPTLTNFPLVVSLSETSPIGFLYERAGLTGEDLTFTDASGDTILPYQLITWDTNGTSQVYVRIPELKRAVQKIRLYWKVRDGINPPSHNPDQVWSDWTLADWNKISKPGTSYASPVCRDGKFIDYWTQEPAMSAYYWDTQDDASKKGTITKAGKLKFNTATWYITNLVTGVTWQKPANSFPATLDGGIYRLVYELVDETGAYEPIETHVNFTIKGHTPWDDLRGNAGSVTLAGRVMLANNDVAPGHEITDQGYWQTREVVTNATTGATLTNDVFWVHGTEEHETYATDNSVTHMLPGTTHKLCFVDGVDEGGEPVMKTLWRMQDVVVGNTIRNDKQLRSTQCVMPWSSTSLGMSSYDQRNVQGDMLESANLILRNMASAVVYSPCYTNGLGTIYFDAVNSNNNDFEPINYYHLVVDIATETEDGSDPTDENAKDGNRDDIGGELGKITNEQWKPMTVLPFYYDGTSFTPCDETNDFALACAATRSTNCFYRIVVPVNIRKPVRFRIRRLYANPDKTEDSGCLILLDNIVCSYPMMGADIVSDGLYDKDRTKERTLGWENALVPPFPAVTDTAIYGRGKMDTFVNESTNANPKGFILSSTMHYRWHYLDQMSNDWRSVELAAGDDFLAQTPLVLPRKEDGKIPEGDIEYWFETKIDVPYYEYFDYSGLNVGLKGAGDKPLYTEERTAVTNRLSETENWSVRLRLGRLRNDAECYRLWYKTSEDAEPQAVEMEVAGDGLVRGYVQTLKPIEGEGLYVRFEELNRQTSGETGFASNVTYYALKDNVTDLSLPSTLVPGGEDVWSRVVCDAKTGYLLFQLAEAKQTMTVVHADRQNFNKWTDANREDRLFIGTATYTNDTGTIAGTSEKTREVTAPLDRWHLSLATGQDGMWSESFKATKEAMITPGGYWEIYQPFAKKTSPNGLQVGPGQWVPSAYNDCGTGMALQMEGCGQGYIQFVKEKENSPRGLESIVLDARIAQPITYNDFAYRSGDALNYTNYTFWCRGAYDVFKRTAFTGNASLSLVAFYRTGEGFYELRVMQDDAKISDKVTGPGDIQRLRLFRWNYDDVSGDVLPTFLGETTVSGSGVMTTDGEKGDYGLLFISAKNTGTKTEIVAGISQNCKKVNDTSKATCQTLSYRDASPDRIVNGTYGVLSANCPARFRYLNYLAKSQTCTVDKDNAYKAASNFSFTPDPDASVSCQDDINRGGWVNAKRRMNTTDMDNGTMFGLKAKDVSQTVKVYVGNAGSASFDEPLLTQPISGFGSTVPIRIPMYTTTDGSSVRIEAGGEKNQMRTDVVVDNIEFRQWRGESYDDTEGQKYFEELAGRFYDGCPTNFVFTTAWNELGYTVVGGKAVTVTNCQLNARRARVGEVVSIRSPLFDGGGSEEEGTKRGLGLGRFEFSYENAQTNVVLSLQIATNNVSIAGLQTLTKEMNANWTTVTNYNFATLPASGTLKHYFGLHGVKGVMRLAMHPDVIKDVSTNMTDTTAFGSIVITGVLCSDEPVLDERSWWGWNVQTTDEHERRNLWDATPTGLGEGLGFALNNAVGDRILEKDKELYKKHLPFLQTPTFGEGVTVGEVSFRVRKYAKDDPTAYVTLYGAMSGGAPDDMWKKLERWEIKNEVYEAKSFKTKTDQNYAAFRFAVSGVSGVDKPTMEDGENPPSPQRVLIDDVVVFEAIRATVSFRNVSAFRTNLDTLLAIENVTDRSQQPLCREAWGVQAEVYAEQLADDVDLSKAKVRLWWYESVEPWGFDRWKGLPGAKSVELPRCIGTDPDVYIFRSSYAGGMGTVLPEQTNAGTVQFMLEVDYVTSDGTPVTHRLKVAKEGAEWTNPPWYAPVDYNAERGEDYLYASAYSIFDTVAPGWAWFNEVNIYGEVPWRNTDKAFQFLEIAAPFDADLTGWTVRFLDAQVGSGKIVTNDVAYFGSGAGAIPGIKKCQDHMDPVSKCVFHVIASPNVLTFDPAKGEIDGRWKITQSNWAVGLSGEIDSEYPVSMQLVRPSGIVEHEVVFLGTNSWAGSAEYEPERHVDMLNASERGGRWFYAGMDNGGLVPGKDGSRSIGVHWGNGGTEKTFAEEASRYWNSTNYMTPGAINGQQVISPDCPRPLGSSAIIVSQITGGHMTQSFGDAERTNGLVSILFRKGDKNGTNITYHVERWYELATLTTNGAPVPVPVPVGHDYVVNVGREISNDVTVVASADVMSALETQYGIAPDNKYREALVKWLQDGTLKDGTPFSGPNKDTDAVGLGEYHALDKDYKEPLTLQSMFWLDMDPTWNNGDLWFCAGTTEIDKTTRSPNVLLKVKMVITNTSDLAEAGKGPGKKYWAPYVLRSSKPDLTSWEFNDQEASGTWNWGDVTFKVTGFMNNGLTKVGQRDNWAPLRWFVFGKYSFDSNFESVIEMTDPTSRGSAGAAYGWYQWMQEHPEWSPSFYFRWDIDERLRPVAVELLRPDSRY